MLLELTISNLAIIESLRLQFSDGLNVLTGETGAGKSIIVDAVALLLGERASSEMIRSSAETLTIEGVFELSAALADTLRPTLEELGLYDGENTLILQREISRSRRSIARANGRAVTLNVLQDIAHHLVDIHGQGEHLSLLDVHQHINFLDHYGGLYPLRREFADLTQRIGTARRELASLRRDERELARRVDLLSFQVDEIRSARLQPDEEDELLQERKLLDSVEKRIELASSVYDLVSGGTDEQPSISDLLDLAVEALDELSELDNSLAPQSQSLSSAYYEIEELTRTMRGYRDALEFDPKRLSAVENRIELIHGLKRKYGSSIEEILAFAAHAEAELDSISHSEERIEELQTLVRALLVEAGELGQRLSTARREAAEKLCRAIESELDDLEMAQAELKIDIRWQENERGAQVGDKRYAYESTGLDIVEFLISPNPGEDPKPLVRIASGGETSRLMLAMKTALSAIDPVPTLIFDEIDSGIGGHTGATVGDKLYSLASDHQVFCVTHLAQIASRGDQHYHVAKSVVEGRTLSEVQLLDDEARVEELAVMLGGRTTTATRQTARELLARNKPVATG